MEHENRSWWKILIITIIPTLGLLIAMFNNSLQIIERIFPKKEIYKTETTINNKVDSSKFRNPKPHSFPVKVLEFENKYKIEELLKNARDNRSTSRSYAYDYYVKAFNQLPTDRKNEKFLSLISTKDFGTQINYLDSFFVSLNY